MVKRIRITVMVFAYPNLSYFLKQKTPVNYGIFLYVVPAI